MYVFPFLWFQIIFTACELGVFDVLMESGEPLSSEMIAEQLGANSNALESLMNACVSLNLLRIEEKDDKGKGQSNCKFINSSFTDLKKNS